MEIRPTTDQDLPVFLGVVHAAFGRFTETPTDGGGLFCTERAPDCLHWF